MHMPIKVLKETLFTPLLMVLYWEEGTILPAEGYLMISRDIFVATLGRGTATSSPE